MDPTYGSRLRRVREKRGWTLEELAEAVEISKSALSRIERGEQALTVNQLVAIARALRVRIDRLIMPRGTSASGGRSTSAPRPRPG